MGDKFEDLPIGTKIEMFVIDPIEGKLDIEFVSQVENYIEKDKLMISAPIHEAKIYPVRVNSKIEAYAYRNNHIYKIVGFVENRHNIEEIAMLEVHVTEKLKKVQRRQFFRFECSIPVVFYKTVMHGSEVKVYPIFGRTLNLSGGGLSALLEKPIPKVDEITGLLELENNNFLEFKGKVIRCMAEVISEELKYTASISFKELSYKEREKIIGYIFNQQRLYLNRGLR